MVGGASYLTLMVMSGFISNVEISAANKSSLTSGLLWGFIMDKVYGAKPGTVDEFKSFECAEIARELFKCGDFIVPILALHRSVWSLSKRSELSTKKTILMWFVTFKVNCTIFNKYFSNKQSVATFFGISF